MMTSTRRAVRQFLAIFGAATASAVHTSALKAVMASGGISGSSTPPPPSSGPTSLPSSLPPSLAADSVAIAGVASGGSAKNIVEGCVGPAGCTLCAMRGPVQSLILPAVRAAIYVVVGSSW